MIMNYNEFRLEMLNRPFFTSKDLSGVEKLDPTLKLQLHKWIKQNKIIRLKKGVYTLNDTDRKAELSPFFLANELYSPSYLSLESALSYYDLIPEAVNNFTSITTNKTKTIKNIYGTFYYNSIKKEYFWGFQNIKLKNNIFFFIAAPEKAVVDFIYFKIHSTVKDLKNELIENYRFQNLDILNIDTLLNYKPKLKEKKMLKSIEILKELILEWS